VLFTLVTIARVYCTIRRAYLVYISPSDSYVVFGNVVRFRFWECVIRFFKNYFTFDRTFVNKRQFLRLTVGRALFVIRNSHGNTRNTGISWKTFFLEKSYLLVKHLFEKIPLGLLTSIFPEFP